MLSILRALWYRTFTLSLFGMCFGAGFCAAQNDAPLTPREKDLLERIEKLEQRIAALEGAKPVPAPVPAASAAEVTSAPASAPPSLPAATTVNFYLDGYYGYNFNRPPGRLSPLRGNDSTTNNFTLGQATVIVERAVDAANGKRFGGRIDLMFGQNTEYLQGNSTSEPRPQIYRNIFQAYGSAVVPVGSGLQIDFGKFASGLGIENNYVKDQINYSRSYFFTMLPAYHMGVRATYNLSPKLSVQYWAVNGLNQTEDFNGFKSQAALVTYTPSPKFTVNANYFFGPEAKSSGVAPVPDGKLHLLDSYFTWNLTSRLTFAGEMDYVINREFAHSPPHSLIGGVSYLRYQFTPKFSLAERFGYLSDHGAIFSGQPQALKATTTTATYQPADGFQLRAEFRRDFSNQRFFVTDRPGVLRPSQTTALLGAIWWFGGKQGAW